MQLLTTRNSNTQNPLQDLRYTYDPVGNIVEIYDASKETSYYKNSVIEPRHLFTYDALYRLLSGTGRELLGLAQASSGGYAANSAGAADAKALHTYTQNFAYDELGNIKSIQHTTLTSTLNWTRNYVYDEATNRLLKHDDNQTLPDYTYDEHGNITKMPHLQSMHYDYKDQLNSVMLDASENMAYYVYDSNGQRVRKVVIKGNVREERIYVGSYERYIKTENGSQTIERISVSIAEVAEEPREEEDNSRAVYHIDLNKRIALIEYIEGQSPTIRYQLGNHLGSASLELNATGQIISYEEFHPFGTTSYRSGTNETEVSQKRYKYIGKERDEETELYYYGARYYAAWIGRFVSVDPLAEEAYELTPYRYAQNNPIKIYDPDGLDDFFDFNGKYVGSTKNGDQIRIINNKTTFSQAKSNVTENTKKLIDYNYSPKNQRNRTMLSNVATHYAHKAGVSSNKSVQILDINNSSKGDAFAAFNPKSGQYLITVNQKGNVNHEANNIFNMENSFVHEIVHEVDPSSRTAFGEIKAILKQSNDMSFFDTSDKFKSAAGAYAAINLNAALKGGEINEHQAKQAINQLNASPLGIFVLLHYDSKSQTVMYTINLKEFKIVAPSK